MRKKSITLAALAVAGSLTLAACGSSDSMGNMPGMGSSSTSSSPTPNSSSMADFNDADVTFATDMIPHHRQAVEMAKLAETRAASQKVKDLAMQIMNAQDPEIQTMSSWLTAWGKPVPADMGGMDMSGSMPGMMSSSDMADLKKASGADFDQMFLTMMIAHHQGAIEMAKTEETGGMNTDAIALAQQIEAAQTTEITTMKGLLK
ncbi:DUF305 domain-containing protein [Nocardioides sp. TRM66260-LWL]|uniref:DUF305 domain-containing protein n=1 Tax=Nocardioides sp. TRM66260-LWL TaxID=2874478 RepID=UPI001CC67913|nr:DUF305 domain-containing protein [Nocardioides sp. TRM66260-LWL]MBZ5736407.1 DUF305 domain-containing protein [Nocardioides sp. TRM66260-LWL]